MSGAWIGAGVALVGAAGGAHSQQKGRKLTKKGMKEQKEQLAEQEKSEKLRLAEAESEIGRRKSLRQGGGRSMLLSQGAQQGSTTIGG